MMTASAEAYGRELARSLTEQPLQVLVTGRVGLPPDELFAFITDVERLARWIPSVRKSWSDDGEAETPQGVGAVRMMDAGFGPPGQERVVLFERPRAYAYRASDATLRGLFTDHVSILTIEPHPAGGSVLHWFAYARPAKSRVVQWVAGQVFGRVLGGGLRNLQKRFPV